MSHQTEMKSSGKEVLLAVFGKSGTGKSSLCNRITRTDAFPVGHGLQSLTTKKQEQKLEDGMNVMDTPAELPDMVTCAKELRKRARKDSLEIRIIYCIRCDTRYAAEEHSTYKSIKKAWKRKPDFCKRLIVAFTHGEVLCEDNNETDAVDSQGTSKASAGKHGTDKNTGIPTDLDTKLKTFLKDTWPPLKKVIKDAKGGYFIFTNKVKKSQDGADDQDDAVGNLLKYVSETKVSTSSKACVIL